MQQTEMWREVVGQTLIEVSVAALTTEPELIDVGRSLVALVRYHEAKQRETAR